MEVDDSWSDILKQSHIMTVDRNRIERQREYRPLKRGILMSTLAVTRSINSNVKHHYKQ